MYPVRLNKHASPGGPWSIRPGQQKLRLILFIHKEVRTQGGIASALSQTSLDSLHGNRHCHGHSERAGDGAERSPGRPRPTPGRSPVLEGGNGMSGVKVVSPLDLITMHGLEADLQDWASAADDGAFADL